MRFTLGTNAEQQAHSKHVLTLVDLTQAEETRLNLRVTQEHPEGTAQGEPALSGKSQEALSPASLRNGTRRLAPQQTQL